MKLFQFIRIYGVEETIVEQLRSDGLLRSNLICSKCGEFMSQRSKNVKDKIAFLCAKATCRVERSIRTGTFFENVRLGLCDCMLLIHLWCKKYTEKLICDDFLFSNKTVVDWFKFCRELCVYHYEENNVLIGGPGIQVEIDETHVVRRKNNTGRILSAGWLFGGIERSTDGSFRAFFRLIYNRSGPHLKFLINQHVRPGSHIITDGWAGYTGLSEMGYHHTVVIHEKNFVSPINRETHTQKIEATWGSLKRFLRQRGTNKSNFLTEYICEYIFRRTYDDVFSSLINVIKNKYNIL